VHKFSLSDLPNPELFLKRRKFKTAPTVHAPKQSGGSRDTFGEYVRKVNQRCVQMSQDACGFRSFTFRSDLHVVSSGFSARSALRAALFRPSFRLERRPGRRPVPPRRWAPCSTRRTCRRSRSLRPVCSSTRSTLPSSASTRFPASSTSHPMSKPCWTRRCVIALRMNCGLVNFWVADNCRIEDQWISCSENQQTGHRFAADQHFWESQPQAAGRRHTKTWWKSGFEQIQLQFWVLKSYYSSFILFYHMSNFATFFHIWFGGVSKF